MKAVRMEYKNGEWRLVVVGTKKIVSRNSDEKKCFQFLEGNTQYFYEPIMKKDVHYVV